MSALRNGLDGTAAVPAHTHPASDIVSGVLAEARLPTATATTKGIVELATDAEAATGTSTTLAITPANLASVLGSTSFDNVKTDVFIAGTSGTLTLESWTKTVRVQAWSGGGGGASGDRRNAATGLRGGGGGGAGTYVEVVLPVFALSSPVSYSVGSGGAGGAAQTADNSGINAGSDGEDTTFGPVYAGKGGGAPTSAGGSGASFSYCGMAIIARTSGGAGSGANGAAGLAPSDPNVAVPTSGGGGGGSAANVTTSSAGGNGGDWNANTTTLFPSVTTAAGGAAAGSNGADGGSALGMGLGGGGGAGNGSAAGTGGNGGAGGFPGGGGGGGGGSRNGYNSGAGGNGGDGHLIVTQYG